MHIHWTDVQCVLHLDEPPTYNAFCRGCDWRGKVKKTWRKAYKNGRKHMKNAKSNR